ncbi:uncharacterized protein METZ01_LOCUS365320, partial [marine metagenome]
SKKKTAVFGISARLQSLEKDSHRLEKTSKSFQEWLPKLILWVAKKPFSIICCSRSQKLPMRPSENG